MFIEIQEGVEILKRCSEVVFWKIRCLIVSTVTLKMIMNQFTWNILNKIGYSQNISSSFFFLSTISSNANSWKSLSLFKDVLSVLELLCGLLQLSSI
jgi:hypothetical protein